MTAAVVELDALADPVRAAAQDDDLALRRRIRFAHLLVGPVHIRGERLEFGGARVDPLVRRARVPPRAAAAAPGLRRCRARRRCRCRQNRCASACAAGRSTSRGTPRARRCCEAVQSPRTAAGTRGRFSSARAASRSSSRAGARGRAPTCADRWGRPAVYAERSRPRSRPRCRPGSTETGCPTCRARAIAPP